MSKVCMHLSDTIMCVDMIMYITYVLLYLFTHIHTCVYLFKHMYIIISIFIMCFKCRCNT